MSGKLRRTPVEHSNKFKRAFILSGLRPLTVIVFNAMLDIDIGSNVDSTSTKKGTDDVSNVVYLWHTQFSGRGSVMPHEVRMRLDGVSLSSVPPGPPLPAPSSMSGSTPLARPFVGVAKELAADLEPFFLTLPVGMGWPMVSRKPMTSETTSGWESKVFWMWDRSLRNLISRARTCKRARWSCGSNWRKCCFGFSSAEAISSKSVCALVFVATPRCMLARALEQKQQVERIVCVCVCVLSAGWRLHDKHLAMARATCATQVCLFVCPEITDVPGRLQATVPETLDAEFASIVGRSMV